MAILSYVHEIQTVHLCCRITVTVRTCHTLVAVLMQYPGSEVLSVFVAGLIIVAGRQATLLQILHHDDPKTL